MSSEAEEAVVGAILCGGRSRRFGSDKALADVAGRPLAASIVDALRSAGADPVAAIGGSAGPELGIPTVPDRYPDQGPLAGLATALRYAGRGLVVVTPCDVPLLRAEHVETLLAAASGSPDQPAIATVDGRPEPSLAVWPAALGSMVAAAVAGGHRAWRHGLDLGPWQGVEVPADAIADADTPAELRALLARIR